MIQRNAIHKMLQRLLLTFCYCGRLAFSYSAFWQQQQQLDL
jgi:hypothetical protein